MNDATPGVKDGGAQDDLETFVAGLGEPFTSFARALILADRARQRQHKAEVGGDIDAREKAILAREEAAAAAYRIKDHAATRLLFAVRAAAELYPGHLQALLDPYYRRELDATQAAVVDVEHRLDEAEDYLVAVELKQRGAA